MNLLLLLPLALPFLCLAAVSLVGFFGVLAIGAVLQVVASIKSGLSDHRSPGDVMEGVIGGGFRLPPSMAFSGRSSSKTFFHSRPRRRS
jgi:hypothetical protein